MKKQLYLLLNIFITTITAQQIDISGYVIDAETSETLIGASVYQQETRQGVSSNKFGHFTLKTTTDTANIYCSYVGYKTLKTLIYKDTVIIYRLQRGTTLAEVKVTPMQNVERLKNMSRVHIPTQDLKIIPSLTGEANIMKAYQLMPGIQSGKEGYSGLMVRGGSPDQNLFLLDDLPLYNVVHFGGFYSSFDPAMIKDVTLYKGDFPARYGGRISSVVDVRNIDGNMSEIHGEIVFSLLLSKLFLEGPIKKDKASFAISLRRSNLDLITTPFNYITNNSSNSGFSFYDFNAKGNYILSTNDRVFLNIYQGNDRLFDNIPKQSSAMIENKSSYQIKWGNTGFSTRWYHIFSNRIFCNTTLAYSGYRYLNKAKEKQHYLNEDKKYSSIYKFKTGIQDYMIKSDFEIPLFSQIARAGANLSYKRFTPYSYTLKETVDAENSRKHTKENISSGELSLYVEYDLNPRPNLVINAGLHYNLYTVQNRTFQSLQPRLIATYHLIPRLTVKASYTHMQQNMHLLSNANPGLPNDLWLPATNYAPPLKSKQTSLGITYAISEHYEIGIEAYQKKLTNLVEYNEGALIFDSNVKLEDNIANNGTGNARGLEFLVRKNKGRATGWIAYTLSKSERQFDQLNKGKIFPFTYDRRHDLSIVYNYHLRKDLTLSTTWIFQTGHAATLAQGKYQIPNYNYVPSIYNGESSEIHIYTERNGYRMPNYHRLDLGITRTKPKPKGTAIWSLTAYNVYNRQNAYYLYFKDKDGQLKLYQQSIFPIILNFGYTYKF